MKKFNLPLIAALVAAFVLLLIFTPFLLYDGVEVKEVENITTEFSENLMFREERWYYPMSGMVVEMENETIPIGVAGQKHELNFGRIPEQSSSTKIIEFGTGSPARVEFYSGGNISSLIELPEKFYLRKESEIKITFNGSRTGNFTGTLLIRNVIPKNFLAEKIIMVM